MTDVVIAALIAGAAAVIGNWLLARKKDFEREKAQAVRDQKIDDAFEAVIERLDEHNNYAKKFGEVTVDINDMKISITKMEKDIDYLKGK